MKDLLIKVMQQAGTIVFLVIILWLGSGRLSGWSQGAATLTEAELTAKIEERAKNHANAGEQMYPTDVYEEFQDNALGWERSQIIDVYEAAFIAERDRLESDLSEQLPLSWITGAIMLVLGASLTFLQEKLSQVVNATGEWIYQRVAGNRWFLRWALEKYQTALRDKLQNLTTPFKIDPPLAMQAVYVPLKIKESSDGHTEAELDVYQALTQHRRLMVLGAPGSGKSVLLKHIAYTYSENQLDLPGNPIPVRLELNTFREGELDPQKFIDALIKVFEDHNFPKAASFVAQSLDAGTLLLLLDGLDEVGTEARPKVVEVINSVLNKYNHCPAIVTCRTQVYDHQFDVVLNRNVLEVMEFSDAQMRRFLQAWKDRMPAEKSVEQLMQTLQDRPNIKGIARNPLMLTFITYLYLNPSFILPYSRSDFYEKATNLLLELRDQERGIYNHYGVPAKRQVLRKLALAIQDPRNAEGNRRTIAQTAAFQVINALMPDLNLDSSHTEPIVQEIIDRSGLLLAIDGGERYQFAHLTLQEFFAAAAIQNNRDTLVNYYQADRDGWREVAKLWCGIAGDSTAFIEQLYQHDRLTGFECLADAKEVQKVLSDRIVQEMCDLFSQSPQEETLLRAFGTVAASANQQQQRGNVTFAFLEQQLQSGNFQYQKAAAEALSYTNLPRAAEVLAAVLPQADLAGVGADALIRMGDVAVMALEKIAQGGLEAAVDELWRIQTPDAAKALVTLLRHDTETLANRAAWHLASLLPQTPIEEELRELSLPPHVSELDWIWTPFREPKNSGLPIIASQIAAFLVKHSQPDLLRSSSVDQNLSRTPDPRLMIPLCTIVEKPVEALSVEDQGLIDDLKNSLDTSPLPKVPYNLSQIVQDIVSPKNAQTLWSRLLHNLSPLFQLEVLYRLITSAHWPDQRDWEYLLQPTQAYVFAQREHYRSILWLSAVASGLAVTEMVWQIVEHPDRAINGLITLCTVIIGIFWLALKEAVWQPELFDKLGVQGVLTFGNTAPKLQQNLPLWPGIDSLYKALTGAGAGFLNIRTGHKIIGSVFWSVAFFGAWSWTGVGAIFWAWIGALLLDIWDLRSSLSTTLSVPIIFAHTIANFVGWVLGRWWTQAAETVAHAVFWTIFWTMFAIVSVPIFIAWIIAHAWFLIGIMATGTTIILGLIGAVDWVDAVPVAVAWTNVGSLALAGGLMCGTGIASLHEVYETQSKENASISLQTKILSFLSLPYFCWFPVTLWFSFWGLHRGFQFAGITPSWLVALAVQGLVLLLGTWLWRYGTEKERRAKNPLQGILDKAYPQYKGKHSN